MASRTVLPQCPTSGPNYAWASRLVQSMQIALDEAARASSTKIVLANDLTPVTSFDPATATLSQVAQAVAALIASQQRLGGT